MITLAVDAAPCGLFLNSGIS